MKFQAIVDLLRRRVVVSISCMIMIGCAGVYFFHMDKKADLESEIEQLDIRMSTILKNLKNSSGLEEDLVEADKRIEGLDARLFDSQELATNYNYFFNLENETGVKLSGLKQLEYKEESGTTKKRKMPKPTKEAYEKIRYHMKATGEYGQIVNFMRRLEGGESFYRLEKFRLARPRDESSKLLSMDLSLLILGRKSS